MKIVKWTLVSLILIITIAGIAFSAPTDSLTKKPTIYALLAVADADPAIGRAVEVDRQRMEGMLKVAAGICDVQTQQLLSSRNELKSEPILQWIKDVNPDTNDTIFIYYSGHGGMNKNKETFFYLQDGYFFRSKIVSAIEGIKKCRLKMLVTDCCSDGPESEVPSGRPPISKKALQDLFLGHEGFLHLSAASEGEYSWCSPRYGGWFTRAMVDSFDDSTDMNMDGFVGWDEVLKLATETVQKKFQQSSMYFSEDQKNDMAKRGIKSQTPKSYSMPKRFDMSKLTQTAQDTSKKPDISTDTTSDQETKKPEDTLWNISSSNSYFSISIEPDKQKYDITNNIVFRLKSTADCYIIILNWSSKGEPFQLFPNKYESSNFAVRSKTYELPSADSKFDLKVTGSKGEEKIKIIALRNRQDSIKLRSLIPIEDSYGSYSSRISILPKTTSAKDDIEAKILKALKELNQSDWASANCIIQIR